MAVRSATENTAMFSEHDRQVLALSVFVTAEEDLCEAAVSSNASFLFSAFLLYCITERQTLSVPDFTAISGLQKNRRKSLAD